MEMKEPHGKAGTEGTDIPGQWAARVWSQPKQAKQAWKKVAIVELPHRNIALCEWMKSLFDPENLTGWSIAVHTATLPHYFHSLLLLMGISVVMICSTPSVFLLLLTAMKCAFFVQMNPGEEMRTYSCWGHWVTRNTNSTRPHACFLKAFLSSKFKMAGLVVTRLNENQPSSFYT